MLRTNSNFANFIQFMIDKGKDYAYPEWQRRIIEAVESGRRPVRSMSYGRWQSILLMMKMEWMLGGTTMMVSPGLMMLKERPEDKKSMMIMDDPFAEVKHTDEEIEKKLLVELGDAEAKAWDALSRYKFSMFGYWAAIWVHLNRISGAKRNNPWKSLVHLARENVHGGQNGR